MLAWSLLGRRWVLVTGVCVHVEVLAAGVQYLIVNVGFCGSVVGRAKAPDTRGLKSRLPPINDTSAVETIDYIPRLSGTWLG